MIRFFRFAPFKLALTYIALSIFVLGLFAVPLWYAWRANYEEARTYVFQDDVEKLTEVLRRDGVQNLAATIDSQVSNRPVGEKVIVLADASGTRVAGNLSAWPSEIPQAPGTYGQVINVSGKSMRFVVNYSILPGGYHLLVGSESARFRSLVDLFKYGLAGAICLILVVGVAGGWMTRRTLLSDLRDISQTASAIAGGDLTHRLPSPEGSDELACLASTINDMLEQLASRNAQLASEIKVRRDAEDALQRSRDELEELVAQRTAHLDGLFDLAPDAIVLTDLSHPRIIRINKEFTRMFGYTPEEAVGQRLRHLIVPRDVAPARLTENADLLAGKTVENEVVRRRKDGSSFHAHITAKRVRLHDAEGTAYIIYRDITERTQSMEARRRSEAELRESEKRYALAMEASGAGHWDWNIASDEYYASPRHRELGGLPPDATWTNRADYVARFPFHPEDRPKWEAAVAAHLAGKTARFDIEVRIVPHDVRWIHMTGICIRDSAGSPVRWVGSMIDISERKLAEERLRQSERQLRQAQRLEAIGTLAGGIAHDFNNILGAILGYGEMALRNVPKGSRLRRDLDSIMTAGERGRALVERILAFSRSGVGERVKVHVESIVNEVLDMLAPGLPSNIRIEARLNAGRAAALGDPTQVHQVVMNLASNAIQAMPAGGALQVSLEFKSIDAPRNVTAGSLAVGHYLVLRMADSGTGMSPDILERIFNPFFSTKEVGVGTGLGLSLVHGIVTGMDGAIDVVSTQGAGSTFTVYLPGVGEAADDRKDQTTVAPQGDGQRILIVDDEEPLVALAARTLEELGYVPVGFTSSADALVAFRADPNEFDALITDERMPGMSGSELIREVRALRRAMPILLVSGLASGSVVGRAYNAGADEVLKKPMSSRDLATSLARVLHP